MISSNTGSPGALREPQESPPTSDHVEPAPSGLEQPHTPLPQSHRQLHHEVWRLAWPSVMTMLLQTVNGLLDMFFVGHLPDSSQALAATGTGGGIIFLLISLAMGVSVGTTALVARFTGAGEPEQALRATGQSLTLGVLIGLLFGIPTYLGRDLIIGQMLGGGRNPEAVAQCSQFLAMALLGVVPMFWMNVLQAAYRGLGDTRTPMRVTLVVIGTHILFNLLLIQGRFGFPAMGVRGAGIALAISLFVGAALFTLTLWRSSPLKEVFQSDYVRPNLDWMRRILRIGIPASVQALTRTFSMMLFTGMLARTIEGASAVAALQIGIRAEGIAFMPGFGYSVAASALVGQSLGARDPLKAERSGWAATAQAMLVMCLMAGIFFLLATPISRVFTSDVMVQELGADYLRTNAICEPFLALGMVLTGALQGAGDTVRPTFITVLTMIIIRLPVAWLLMFKLNLHTHGAWLSMLITTIVGGLLTAALFRQGQWKKIKV